MGRRLGRNFDFSTALRLHSCTPHLEPKMCSTEAFLLGYIDFVSQHMFYIELSFDSLAVSVLVARKFERSICVVLEKRASILFLT